MCGEKTQACSYISPSPPKIPSTFTFLHVSNLGGDPEVSWLFLSPQNMLYHEGLCDGEVRCGSDADYESNGAFSFRIPLCLLFVWAEATWICCVIKCVFRNCGSLLHYEDM